MSMIVSLFIVRCSLLCDTLRVFPNWARRSPGHGKEVHLLGIEADFDPNQLLGLAAVGLADVELVIAVVDDV